MRVTVDSIVSEKPYGVIFAATALEPDSDMPGLRVRAEFRHLLGAPAVGDTWEIEGKIEQTRFGPQLAARSGVRVLTSGYMIKRFLAAHVPGIGQVRADRLWNAFGENLPELLANDDVLDEIAKVISPDKPSLGRSLALLVTSAWRKAAGETALVAWLDSQGVRDLALARRLSRVFGDRAVEILASNPYVMVPLVSWKRTDEIGRRLLREDGRDPDNDVRRAVGASDEIVKQMLRRGDTAMQARKFESALGSALGFSPDVAETRRAIEAAARNGAALWCGDFCRAPGAAGLEDGLTVSRRNLAETPPEPLTGGLSSGDRSKARSHATDPLGGSEGEQRAAAVGMMARRLGCLVGGAGTGKTYTCRMICDLWEKSGGKVVLCALAGKAALRLSRSTGRLAKTIARTLNELAERAELERALKAGTADGRERDDALSRLASLSEITDRTLVVVVEASMVDLPTMHAIVRSMVPGSRLLLVGDEAQLPPIGFGLVFHRLVSDPKVTLRLAQIRRQAAPTGIPAAAAAIRIGAIPDFREFNGPAAGVSFVGAKPAELAKVLDDVVERLDALDDMLVVTATIKGPAGVERVNERRHARLTAEACLNSGACSGAGSASASP